jgi:Rieske Fe-S protein
MNDQREPSKRKNHQTSEANVPYGATARRGFFVRFVTGTLALLLGAIPAVLGLGFFFHPLVRRKQSDLSASGASERQDADGFIRLDISLSSLPEDGTPVTYKVLNDKVDAWNRFRNVEVGTVWLRRTGDQSVLALSSICPHLGCAVDYRAANGDFFCPCHTSAFDLEGERTNHIPPRGMDRLETRFKLETGDAIWLKYQTFLATTPEKIPVS